MSSQAPEPKQADAPLEFWRRTPPALFPSMMGLFGLGLAWRAASEYAPFALTPWFSDIILGIACILELFVVSSYLSKTSYRPAVVLNDMATVPGRAGVSALSLSVFLFAATLAPISPTIASTALFLALPIHCITTLFALIIMLRTPDGLIVSPAWHLSFVGFIVACLAAVPLGYIGLARTILLLTVLSSVVIYAVSLLQMSKSDTPLPLRPMLAIHLAPVSLFTIVCSLLGYSFLTLLFATLAIGVAGLLLSSVRYLTGAGFSPLWGAFTFPIAALSVALFTLSAQVAAFAWLALLPLLLISCLTPFVVIRVLVMWATGALAAKTGAATA